MRHVLSSWPRLVELGLLCRVRMSRAGVDLQLYDLLAPEPRLRQHTLDGEAQDAIRVAGHHPPIRNRLEPAWVAGVAIVHLLLFFAAGHPHLLGVDDHHEIAAVEVRAERWLMFTAQQ